MEQRTEHFNDLKHTLMIMKKTSDKDELPFQLSTMYLLDQGALCFVKVPQVRGLISDIVRLCSEHSCKILFSPFLAGH